MILFATGEHAPTQILKSEISPEMSRLIEVATIANEITRYARVPNFSNELALFAATSGMLIDVTISFVSSAVCDNQ